MINMPLVGGFPEPLFGKLRTHSLGTAPGMISVIFQNGVPLLFIECIPIGTMFSKLGIMEHQAKPFLFFKFGFRTFFEITRKMDDKINPIIPGQFVPWTQFGKSTPFQYQIHPIFAFEFSPMAILCKRRMDYQQLAPIPAV